MRLRQNFEKSDKPTNAPEIQTETLGANENSNNQVNIEDFN